MLVTFAQRFSRFRAELYLKTPAALERCAANERLAASLTFTRVRLDGLGPLELAGAAAGHQTGQRDKRQER
jgi:hypothetical protein